MNLAIRGALALLLAAALCPRAVADESSLAQKVHAILKANCHRCHGHDGANEGGFNFVLDRQRLVGRKKIVPGDPGKSKLYQRLLSADDPMPPADKKAAPNERRNRHPQAVDRSRRTRFHSSSRAARLPHARRGREGH
jgi:hypothetical protein